MISSFLVERNHFPIDNSFKCPSLYPLTLSDIFVSSLSRDLKRKNYFGIYPNLLWLTLFELFIYRLKCHISKEIIFLFGLFMPISNFDTLMTSQKNHHYFMKIIWTSFLRLIAVKETENSFIECKRDLVFWWW